MSIQRKSTERIELVETHNLALSLKRLDDNSPYSESWKRALIHAMAMAGLGSWEQKKAIREALGLP